MSADGTITRSIDFACPHCGASIHASVAKAGRQIACKSCGEVVPVPLPKVRVGGGRAPATHKLRTPTPESQPAPAQKLQNTPKEPPLQKSDDETSPDGNGGTGVLAVVLLVVFMFVGWGIMQAAPDIRERIATALSDGFNEEKTPPNTPQPISQPPAEEVVLADPPEPPPVEPDKPQSDEVVTAAPAAITAEDVTALISFRLRAQSAIERIESDLKVSKAEAERVGMETEIWDVAIRNAEQSIADYKDRYMATMQFIIDGYRKDKVGVEAIFGTVLTLRRIRTDPKTANFVNDLIKGIQELPVDEKGISVKLESLFDQ